LPTRPPKKEKELGIERVKNELQKYTVKRKSRSTWNATAANERFGIMAGVPRWIGGEKQQVKWLVASTGSPPLRQAATTLAAIAEARKTKKVSVILNN
jgi:hypothetical protein